jgi:N-methylhydantoinase A
VLVNAGVSVIGRLPTAPPAISDRTTSAIAPKSRRQVWLGRWADIPVYDFATLGTEQQVAGPAIVESDTTTVLLLETETARFDPRGWLDITLH